MPAGLTYVSAAGTGWTCGHASGTVTCTRSGPVTSGTTLPAITLTVTVAASAAPSVSNTASVASSTTFDPTTSNNSSTISTNVVYLSLVKSYTLGGPNPVPGTDINYSVAFTNLGGAPLQSLVLVDPNASTTLKINDNADFKVGSVTNTLGSLSSVVVAYSNNSGATFTYTPSSGGGGAPAGYDRNVTHIRWTFTGNLTQTSPNNTGSVAFSVRIR